MANYDFTRDEFHLCWSKGDELVYLDRESLSALSTVLSAALNADQVEMPVDVIEEMLAQMHEMETHFAKAALAEQEAERIAKIVDALERQYVVRYRDDQTIELWNWNESEVLETFETWKEAEAFAKTH